MSDTWRAWLADGREFSEGSPELQGGPRSPFRMLQGMGEIVLVEARLGLRVVALEADGHPLVTGQAADVLLPLAGGGGPTSKRWRWVCRQEPRRWVWRVTDGIGAWEIETPPGEPGRENMPRPQEELRCE